MQTAISAKLAGNFQWDCSNGQMGIPRCRKNSSLIGKYKPARVNIYRSRTQFTFLALPGRSVVGAGGFSQCAARNTFSSSRSREISRGEKIRRLLRGSKESRAKERGEYISRAVLLADSPPPPLLPRTRIRRLSGEKARSSHESFVRYSVRATVP